jgi:hypothetical protein
MVKFVLFVFGYFLEQAVHHGLMPFDGHGISKLKTQLPTKN